jgi:hypothetical protein
VGGGVIGGLGFGRRGGGQRKRLMDERGGRGGERDNGQGRRERIVAGHG